MKTKSLLFPTNNPILEVEFTLENRPTEIEIIRLIILMSKHFGDFDMLFEEKRYDKRQGWKEFLLEGKFNTLKDFHQYNISTEIHICEEDKLQLTTIDEKTITVIFSSEEKHMLFFDFHRFVFVDDYMISQKKAAELNRKILTLFLEDISTFFNWEINKIESLYIRDEFISKKGINPKALLKHSIST